MHFGRWLLPGGGYGGSDNKNECCINSSVRSLAGLAGVAGVAVRGNLDVAKVSQCLEKAPYFAFR